MLEKIREWLRGRKGIITYLMMKYYCTRLDNTIYAAVTKRTIF